MATSPVVTGDHCRAAPDIPLALGAFEVVIAGCHGGAGCTTIAQLLQPHGRVWDMGFNRTGLPNLAGRPLLLVTRCHTDGARQATTVVNHALSRGLKPAGLIVVADGPWPEPKAATVRLRMLWSTPVLVDS